MKENYSAIVFEDGTVLYGKSFGSIGVTTVELCFTTGTTGYQETLTDPSYAGQGVIFSFPHIGNTGTNKIDTESSIVHVKAIITRNNISIDSNHRSIENLKTWLQKNKIYHIYDFDTRAIIKKVTSTGSQNATIITKENDFTLDKNQIAEFAQNAKNYLVKFDEIINEILRIPERNKIINQIVHDTKKNHIKAAVIDYGIKLNILRILENDGFNIEVFPCTTNADKINFENFDCIILSNGPADPNDAIKLNRKIIDKIINSRKPILGICLGHQIIAISHPKLQLQVLKMHQGHRGINHPILNIENKKVEITSQNHGFNVFIEKESQKNSFVTHKSLFDSSVAGISIPQDKIISVQYHPEASPGTHDSRYIFKKFQAMILDKFDAIYDKRNLNVLESNLEYIFKSKNLLLQSLRHPSIQKSHSYEKLEFIGDKVLNTVLAEALLKKFPKDDEGELSLKLNHLVSGKTIVQIAIKVELGKFIEMSQSEEQSNGQDKKGNLEDCMEAIIGGIFLDSDFEITKNVILKLWYDFLENAQKIEKDAKSQLQEWLQKNQLDLPQYILVDKHGPSHNPKFTVKLIAQNLPEFEAKGSSLKEAQSQAAKLAIAHIQSNF
jgi:carbamoyl-phosphate synthase small subunit